MKRTTFLQNVLIILLMLYSASSISNDFIVYSISQEVPMGDPNEKIKKNYYFNIGGDQGLQKGNFLEVFRIVSQVDPYDTKKRYYYRIKIGEVKVIHIEDRSSIGVLAFLEESSDTPVLDIPTIMIGDRVNVKIQ